MASKSARENVAGLSDAASDHALLGSVFESLTSGLVVFDRSLGIIKRNRAAHYMLPRSDNVAELLGLLTIDGACVDWSTELRSVMQSPHSKQFDAMAPRGRDEPEAYVHILIAPLRAGDSGHVIGGLLLADDVTARISMERRLAVSERLAAVGKLAARVAHELNNPLDGILRFTNLALRRADAHPDADTKRYLENIRGGVTRMAQILSTLLEFSRATPGAHEQATFNQIIEDALTAMEGRIRDAGVTVVCNFHEADMPLIRGSSLFQVLCNLIKNAVDAMPEGGTLTLTTDILDGCVIIMVEDTGIGLPHDTKQLFEPFFTTKTDGRGTGLGLAVCRELIERVGGTITAARRQPRGTTMTLRLPLHGAVDADSQTESNRAY